jgi:hypothetical protein
MENSIKSPMTSRATTPPNIASKPSDILPGDLPGEALHSRPSPLSNSAAGGGGGAGGDGGAGASLVGIANAPSVTLTVEEMDSDLDSDRLGAFEKGPKSPLRWDGAYHRSTNQNELNLVQGLYDKVSYTEDAVSHIY